MFSDHEQYKPWRWGHPGKWGQGQTEHNLKSAGSAIAPSRSMTTWTCPRLKFFNFELFENSHFQNVMSGYLMRKFKNKPVTNNSEQARSQRNWQKLCVVLNNFSIYFYKRHQESAPLAHLPLLEYTVKESSPTPSPIASKNFFLILEHKKSSSRHQYVFMIKLKKHEYYFAAETEYFFSDGWIPSRLRLYQMTSKNSAKKTTSGLVNLYYSVLMSSWFSTSLSLSPLSFLITTFGLCT